MGREGVGGGREGGRGRQGGSERGREGGRVSVHASVVSIEVPRRMKVGRGKGRKERGGRNKVNSAIRSRQWPRYCS